MPEMNIVQAVNSALDIMLEKDPDVIFFGEDAGYFGGVFRPQMVCKKSMVNTEFSIHHSPKEALQQSHLVWGLMA